MPRAYSAAFCARAVALVRDSKVQKQTATELGIHPVTLSKWVKQDRIELGKILLIIRPSREVLGEDRPGPKGSSR